ncbi:MAG: fused MFS/spermidine synthase [Bacteroidota bacterium]
MNRPQTLKLHVSLFYIGFGSILTQILLVREFLVSFYGNELSIGIIFACWLVWIGIGSAVGNKVIKRLQRSSYLFFILIFLTPVVTLVQIIAVKFARAFIHTPTGEFLSMMELLGFSFSVLSVGCFLWGMLFTLGAKMFSSEREELWRGVNKAYVLESVGSVAGGLLFSCVLASLLSTLQTAFFLLFSTWSMALWYGLKRKKQFKTAALLCIIVLYYILLQPIRTLEHQMDAYQWSLINDKLTFVRSIDTKYQNLSLLRLENQYTIYTDGRPAYNIPNTYEAEVFIHSILVHRFDAKHVLLLGGGFNGILKEILKYPVQEIEYVEIDPALLPFVEPVLDKQNQQALRDPRVKIISGDGREFLSRKQRSFDVIILNIGEPSTASLNRFFTLEFYQQCSTRLTSDGILAFSFPSSAEYITDEMKNMNASIYHTFKQVFQNILVIPGDRAILMGSRNERPFIQDPDSLAHLYATTGISAEYFSKYMFEEKMPPDRIKYITNTLESIQDYRANTDTDPVTYYFDLLLWNRFLHGDNRFFSSITRMGIFFVGALAVGILLIIILVRRRQIEKRERNALTIIIACGGMIGMALNLLLLLNFQETFGSIYEMLGAMSAVSMLGLALGAMFVIRITQKHKMKFVLLVVLIALVSVVLLLPQLLHLLLRMHSMPFILIVTMVCGGLIGMLFGIVNRLYSHHTTDLGSIYAYDVLGSSVGALIACSVLLPVLGIQEMTMFLALVLVPTIIAAIFTQRGF